MHIAKSLLSILGNAGSIVAAVIAICGLWMARRASKGSKDSG